MAESGCLSGPVEIEDGANAALGRDGFIFHRFDQAFEQLCREAPLPADQITRWVDLISRRHAWCRSRGIPLIFAVTPEKQSVYPDCLPEGYEIARTKPVDQILAALPDPVRQDCLYYGPTLCAGRRHGQIFKRTDVHWTTRGAGLAHNDLARAIGRHMPMAAIPLDALPARIQPFTGDLNFHLRRRVVEQVETLDYQPRLQSQKVFARMSFQRGQVEVFETPGAPARTIVFFRDSNGTTMLPFLLPQFSRAVVIAELRLLREVVQSEPVDVVVVQMAERFLARLDAEGRVVQFPDDEAPPDFAAMTGVRLPLPRGAQNLLVIDFRAGGNAEPFLGTGWSAGERGHRWTDGESATIRLPPTATRGATAIDFTAHPFIHPPALPAQRLTIRFGARIAAEASLSAPKSFSLTLAPEECGRDLLVTLSLPECRRPAEVMPGALHGSDRRRLGIRLDLLHVRRGDAG